MLSCAFCLGRNCAPPTRLPLIGRPLTLSVLLAVAVSRLPLLVVPPRRLTCSLPPSPSSFLNHSLQNNPTSTTLLHRLSSCPYGVCSLTPPCLPCTIGLYVLRDRSLHLRLLRPKPRCRRRRPACNCSSIEIWLATHCFLFALLCRRIWTIRTSSTSSISHLSWTQGWTRQQLARSFSSQSSCLYQGTYLFPFCSSALSVIESILFRPLSSALDASEENSRLALGAPCSSSPAPLYLDISRYPVNVILTGLSYQLPCHSKLHRILGL